jgi:GntR family transcriptional regulator
LRDLLRLRVLSGRFVVAGALPSESELMLEYGASRNVVRDALGLLREEGLIHRLQGAGTFAVSRKVPHRFDVLHGIGAGQPDRNRRLVGEVVSLDLTPAGPTVAERLGVAPTSLCTRVETVVHYDDGPFSLTTSYLAAELAPRLRAAVFGGDWYDYLEQAGASIATCVQWVEAVVADDHVAGWLDVEAGAPVFVFTRWSLDAEGRAVEFSLARVRADRLVLRISQSRATLSEPITPGELP